MNRIWVIAIALTLALGVTTPPVHACQNLVGGVCLDKKPVVKKKARAKTKARKQKRKAKPANAASVRASGCVRVSFKKVGDPRQGAPDSEQVVNILIQNNCGTPVVSYVKLNSCLNPPAYFIGARGKTKRTYKIAAKKRKTVTVVQPDFAPKNTKTARVNSVFSGQKGSYPGGRC